MCHCSKYITSDFCEMTCGCGRRKPFHLATFCYKTLIYLIFCCTHCREAKNIHSKYMRHQAFESEIAANKPRLEKLQNKGSGLMEEKPESTEVVSKINKTTNKTGR